MDYINLVNINLINEKVIFEFLYKAPQIKEGTQIYLENENIDLYYGKVTKAPNKIVYTYFNQDEVEVAKVLIEIELNKLGHFKVKVNDGELVKELRILNNQNLEIANKKNKYIIFSRKHFIQITTEFIKIKKRKMLSKFAYEFGKQMYSLKKYHKFAKYRFCKSKRKYYLFNDRLMYGDDNAEELFKYVNEKNEKIAKNSYFVLDEKSEAINRIKSIGKVVIYGSDEHKKMFINSKMVISSHSSFLDKCFNPFSEEEMDVYKDIINKKFVFLPHGIIMNDIRMYTSRALTTADLFTTSLEREFEYLSSDDYMYEPSQLVKTGLTRYDRLVDKHEKIILVSPTWRNYGEIKDIKETDYYKTYMSFLKNEDLIELLEDYEYTLKFLLHPVFLEYMDEFKSAEDDYVKIISSKDNRYSDLFCECAALVTDYSSIHYDVATMKKPIIYYQFDKEFFFGNHYGAGYFSYENDGFGPVVETEEKLVNYLRYLIERDCSVEKTYLNRIENTFSFLDHDNCKRVMEHINKLDEDKSMDYRFNMNH